MAFANVEVLIPAKIAGMVMYVLLQIMLVYVDVVQALQILLHVQNLRQNLIIVMQQMPFVNARHLWQLVLECQPEHIVILLQTTEMVSANVQKPLMLVHQPQIILHVLITLVNVAHLVPVMFVLRHKSVKPMLAQVSLSFMNQYIAINLTKRKL